jgi:hypothetical protein
MQKRSIHSTRRAIYSPTWWYRRHASAALLPLLPHRHRYPGLWGALLGSLEACAAGRIRLQPRAEKGGAKGWNGRHSGEQPRFSDHRFNSEFMFFVVLQRKGGMKMTRRWVVARAKSFVKGSHLYCLYVTPVSRL